MKKKLTYCESGCDCVLCHDGKHGNRILVCGYCQNKEWRIADIAFEFGEWVIDFRVKHGLTQGKLAKKIKIPIKIIKKIEQN